MKEKADKNQISRRSFIKGMGITTAGAAALNGGIVAKQLEKVGLLKPQDVIPAEGQKISLLVNGQNKSVFVQPRTTLADVLRLNLDLTGTKLGCERGACGACTVILGGKPVNSCMTLAVDAVGLSIETVEGLADGENLHAVQKAFIEYDALQCGFCTSGFVMSSKALLDVNANPNSDQIKDAVSGNLCRCGTYPKVFEAVEAVACGKIK